MISAPIRIGIFLLVAGLQPTVLKAALDDSTAPLEFPTMAAAADLARNLELYREAMASEQYAEAEVLAKSIVQYSIIVNGYESRDSANATTNLAIAQQKQKHYAPAKINYQAAIQNIEASGSLLSADLIRPLQGLAEIEFDTDNIERARELFERIVHVSHVNDGPLNPEQIESLNAIAATYLAVGHIKKTLDIQESVFAISAHAIGAESEEFVPVLRHHAEWMGKLGLYNRARVTNLEILRLQEEHLGDSDKRMIPTLIALGAAPSNLRHVPWDSLYIHRATGPDHYLNRAMRIAEGQADTDWEVAADTAVAVGDYYTQDYRFARAGASYAEAWRWMSAVPQGLIARREQLETPTVLITPYFHEYYEDEQPLYGTVKPREFQKGSITVGFDVSSAGRPVRVRLVESEPGGLKALEKRAISTVKSMLHRPRMENGLKVDTPDHRFTYKFFYRSSAKSVRLEP